VLRIWSTTSGVSSDIVDRLAKTYEEREAVEHLFFLASGLESMVLGEDQVLGQLHKAFLKAKERGTSGIVLDAIFLKAIKVGRRIRTETRINEGSVSISSAAVELAETELGDLKSKKVLIIGAGEAGSLAAEALNGHAVSQITVASRTFEKSKILAEKVNGVAIPFDDAFAVISLSDLVIAAVSVEKPIVTELKLTPFIADQLKPKRTLLIDISQPRAIEEEAGYLPGFSLKKIEDLNQLIAQNLRNRQVEAEKCKALILEELRRFELALSRRVAQPLIDNICRRLEEIRQKELKRAIRKMGESDEKKLAVIDRFSRELVERVAQVPLNKLREAALNGDRELITAAEQLFQIEMKLESHATHSINEPVGH
jgi:glutamyl-tRNA reductase